MNISVEAKPEKPPESHYLRIEPVYTLSLPKLGKSHTDAIRMCLTQLNKKYMYLWIHGNPSCPGNYHMLLPGTHSIEVSPAVSWPELYCLDLMKTCARSSLEYCAAITLAEPHGLLSIAVINKIVSPETDRVMPDSHAQILDIEDRELALRVRYDPCILTIRMVKAPDQHEIYHMEMTYGPSQNTPDLR